MLAIADLGNNNGGLSLGAAGYGEGTSDGPDLDPGAERHGRHGDQLMRPLIWARNR